MTLFHGEDISASYQALQTELAIFRKKSVKICFIDGKSLDLPTLTSLSEQDDFFMTPKILVINNLLARPKSKERTAIIDHLKQTTSPVFLYEIKKISPATIKSLGQITNKLFIQKEAIWQLLEQFSHNNQNRNFISLFELSQKQYEQKNKSEATIYLISMFLWQIQQLIDISSNNFQGPPFKKYSLQMQASKFKLEELIDWYQKLFDFDYQIRAGLIKNNQSEKLLLLLLNIN